uniref:Uncharacterized protein n=1 Tax=Anopheles melas TaxID=34690 RepID=A0A182THF8_9DIPT
MLMMVTKSACDFTIGSTFHCENVPLINTCLPPPSHLNTVGSVLDCSSSCCASSSGPPPPPAPPPGTSDGVVPSDMVLERFRGSRANSGSGTDLEYPYGSTSSSVANGYPWMCGLRSNTNAWSSFIGEPGMGSLDPDL